MSRTVNVPYDIPNIHLIKGYLTDREMFVIERRLGKYPGINRCFSLKEIGYALGLSIERVRVIETISLCKLRHPYIINKLGKRKVEKIANTKRRKSYS